MLGKEVVAVSGDEAFEEVDARAEFLSAFGVGDAAGG